MPAANHLGGDLEGVLHTLQEGYFDSLGMNTVWISPVTPAQRRWGLWQDSARTDVQSRFSSYHGYWPVSYRSGPPIRRTIRNERLDGRSA